MNALTKLKYIKELNEYKKQDVKSLPIRPRLAAIKRMRELIHLLRGDALGEQAQKELPSTDTQPETTGDQNSRDADMEFLQKVMKGEIEPNDQTLDRMNSLVQKYESDDEMNNMISQALNVWLESLLSNVSGMI